MAARSRIVGLAVLPGYEPGQVEAWAAEQTPPVSTVRSPAPGALLHYTSDPAEPLLNPSRRALPLPDTPAPRGDEIALAAFGRSECVETAITCDELTGTGLTNEVQLLRIRDEIVRRAVHDPGLAMAVYTGDVSDVAGEGPARGGLAVAPTDTSFVHDRFEELVRRPLSLATPLFAALGAHDLSDAGVGVPEVRSRLEPFADIVPCRNVAGGTIESFELWPCAGGCAD